MRSGGMFVKQLKVGPMENFVYLVKDEESSEAAVVDSGWETKPILEEAKRSGARIEYVIATHNHFDHSATLGELAEAAGANTAAHESSPLSVDLRLRGGQKIRLGKSELEVLHTPGHTEDSICLYDGTDLFTGDTLFVGTFGRTDLPGGSAVKLFHSIQGTIMKLPPSALIYPGHDYGEVPARTLEEEAGLNPALLARDLRGFLAVVS